MKSLPKPLIMIPFTVCLEVQELNHRSAVVGFNGIKPDRGYAVGGVVTCLTVPLGELCMTTVREFLLEHGLHLLKDHTKCFLGVWVAKGSTPETSEVTLDVVDVLQDQTLALMLGKERKEASIFNLETKQELWLT